MKKLLFTLVVIMLAANAKAQVFKITACSFDSTVAIDTSSMQWVDVLFVQGAYVPSTRVKLWLEYKNNFGTFTEMPHVIYDTLYYPYLHYLPRNPDASFRVHFKMTNQPRKREFRISVNLAPGNHYGVFNPWQPAIISSIFPNRSNTRKPVETHFYNYAGQRMDVPHGNYLQTTYYDDGTVETSQKRLIE